MPRTPLVDEAAEAAVAVAASALDGYLRERDGLRVRVAALRSIDPDTRYVVRSNGGGFTPDLQVGPSAGELLAAAETDLADVEATIAKLEGAN